MKILLLGEYSGLHYTLAQGLRRLGHTVLLVSDGNRWRDYPRDITLRRRSRSHWSAVKYVLRLVGLLPRLRGFDVVQLINPDCFSLKAERQLALFNYLRRHNGKVFVGAFGYDWYWVYSGLHERLFRYGDFYTADGHMRTDEPQVQRFVAEWIGTPKGRLSQQVDTLCDGIPACLYEYYACYSHYFPQKTRYIPLPIVPEHERPVHEYDGRSVRFFIGIDTRRSRYKGTDIMLRALQAVKEKHPDRVSVVVAEHLPYAQYIRLMDTCDCVLDQLYSYTPAMNALEAMSRGLVCIGGGEPECYEILGETELHPIVNVQPTFESVYRAVEQLALHPERLPLLKQQSIDFVRRHHDYRQVAARYVDFWKEAGAVESQELGVRSC